MASHFNLFESPNYEISTQNSYTVQINPSVALTPTQTEIDFVIGQSTDFTNLSATNMYIEIYLSQADGTALPTFDADTSVGLDQTPCSTIFQNIDCKLNGIQTSDNLGTYSYSAYLAQLLNFGYDARSSRQEITGETLFIYFGFYVKK